MRRFLFSRTAAWRAARGWLLALLVVSMVLPAQYGWAAKVTLKDGRVLQGSVVRLSSLGKESITAGDDAPEYKPIVMVTDDLRRYFVPQKQIVNVNETNLGEVDEKFRIPQPIAKVGGRVSQVGPLLHVTPFDEFGQRTVTMQTSRGPVDIVQGITQITPLWSKVEAIRIQGKSLIWSQSIATSSIPRDTLEKILARRLDASKLDERLKVVRLYLQSERYNDAEDELRKVIADFPEQRSKFEPVAISLHQANARRILSELQVRKTAGQHALVSNLLQQFPSEDVAGETLQAVKKMLDDYDVEIKRRALVLTRIDELLATIDDTSLKTGAQPIRDEIFNELSINTLPRMAAFLQLYDDETLAPADKLALAFSGWIVGSDNAVRTLPAALSLVEVRDMVRGYLREGVQLKREDLFRSFSSQESAAPELVAKILTHMKPPRDPGEPVENVYGMFELSVPNASGEAETRYYVQVPPQYDPYKLYPTIVSLHGAGTSPLHQVDWWAGAPDPQRGRLGQASRHGYIVIAPAWAEDHQLNYRYSAAEHAAVLNTLRDACRRFSVDTDRVFLSGHSMGGDAAWDIGLSHPDLWAGVLPIVATSDRYIARYWENAKNVPLYLVGGELDGDKSVRNARDLDRYMKKGYNVTVVEFLGRGHEHFSDEILQVFDWLDRQKRDFFPKQIVGHTMRPWDNFFWWLELDELPPRTQVDPESWPPPRGVLAAKTEGKLLDNNTIHVSSGASKITLWLSPELIDFKQKVNITCNGGKLRADTPFIEPNLLVLLEDARTRGDRQHPFWAKVEMPAGRVNIAGR